ncbi:MAG: hypothetical protein QOC57_487, partial [Ilumatobacteraceae bacterium]
MTRGMLESVMTGQAADSVDPACLPALTVVNGNVTGVAADPAPGAVRACGAFGSFGSGVSATEPIVTAETATATATSAPAATPPPATAP